MFPLSQLTNSPSTPPPRLSSLKCTTTASIAPSATTTTTSRSFRRATPSLPSRRPSFSDRSRSVPSAAVRRPVHYPGSWPGRNYSCACFYFCLLIPGSPHANLNQNNLKYGTDNNRMSTQIQEPTTPPPSPNKNSGQAEKIVLLVCNRACAGQQGRR